MGIYYKSVASIAFISLLLLPFVLVNLIYIYIYIYILSQMYLPKKNLKWEVPKFQADSSIAIVFGGLVLQ